MQFNTLYTTVETFGKLSQAIHIENKCCSYYSEEFYFELYEEILKPFYTIRLTNKLNEEDQEIFHYILGIYQKGYDFFMKKGTMDKRWHELSEYLIVISSSKTKLQTLEEIRQNYNVLLKKKHQYRQDCPYYRRGFYNEINTKIIKICLLILKERALTLKELEVFNKAITLCKEGEIELDDLEVLQNRFLSASPMGDNIEDILETYNNMFSNKKEDYKEEFYFKLYAEILKPFYRIQMERKLTENEEEIFENSLKIYQEGYKNFMDQYMESNIQDLRKKIQWKEILASSKPFVGSSTMDICTNRTLKAIIDQYSTIDDKIL